jgi:hypothetical protein
MPGQ